MKSVFTIRQLDAWAEPDGGWTINDVFLLGTMTTTGNPKRALMRFLKKKRITFKRETIVIEDDMNFLTVCEKKTMCPLFYAELEMRDECEN